MTMSIETIVIILLATGVGVLFVFRGIQAILRHRKQLADLELRRLQEHEKRVGDQRKESVHKEFIRNKDPEVDPIVRDLILAKMALGNVLLCLEEFDVTAENIVQFEKWAQSHKSVLDFYAFEEIVKNFPKSDGESLFFEKEHAQQILEEDFDATSCLEYADKKLGICRGFLYVDGDNYGGIEYEKTNGHFENVNDRFERVLSSIPGAVFS